MSADDALFTDEPMPTADSSLFTDEPPPAASLTSTLANNVKENLGKVGEIFNPTSELSKNAVADVGGMAKGVGDFVVGLDENLPKTVAAIPRGIVEEGKRLGIGQLLTGHPVEAVKQFGKGAYDKPVSTALDLSSGAGAMKSGINALRGGTKAGTLAETAAESIPKSEAIPAPIPEQIAAAAAKPALPPEIQDFVKKQTEVVKSAIPDNVKNYVQSKYQKASETPVQRGTVAQYAEKGAREMAMKNIGASPGQLRKIGEGTANKLADFAYKKGLVNLTTGDIGTADKLAKLSSESGQVVGDMRSLATERGFTHNTENLLSEIHSKLGDRYESGIESGGKGTYTKALQEVAKTPPTPDKIANLVTRLFHKAKEENVAAGIRNLKSPTGPYADVARELRAANESLLKKALTPKEQNMYHNALEDYGASTQLEQFRQMKWSKDMGGRLPPGMGLVRGALQKGLDVVGYRALGKIQNNLAKWLRENPGATTTPKEIFRHLVDESADALDELTGP